MARIYKRLSAVVIFLLFLTKAGIAFGQAGSIAGARVFDKRFEITTNGNMRILANSIISKANNPNENYNGNGNNNSFSSAYIDIDSDASTFSSSSSDYVNTDNCSKIIYAGLYWSAAYPLLGDPAANAYPATDSRADFKAIKFRTPSGSYVDITPASGTYATEVLYDGYRNTATNPSNNVAKDVPYVCYADVTSLVAPQANPNGTYTVANVRGYVGPARSGGAIGGWFMVIVYENPLDTRKYIASYDGFTSVTGTATTDYIVDNFSTIPTGPVRAEYAIGALEGDLGITNDRLRIRANQNATFTLLQNAANPGQNFFNSSISRNGANVSSRLPFGTNTLGFDADIFTIPNPLNTVIPNDETGATFRVETSGDAYSTFVNSFAIEIIAPDLFVSKRVFNTSNVDITGGGVVLGQELFYELQIRNLGNDDAVNTFILDDLPLNVDFIPGFLSAPPGVTIAYDAALRQLRFDIDSNLVEINDATFTIRFKVKVVDDCSQLRDACSNEIRNVARTFYQGAINIAAINSSPSFYALDGCNQGIVGSSNFLINTDDCDFIRNEIICGNSLDITAGNGYTSYTWRDDAGTIIGNTQTITVTAPGTYTVDKVAPAPCVSDTETVNVIFFSTITNPLLGLADNVRTCGIDGSPLPEFFLCGNNDFVQINSGILDADSISWERLNPGSCAAQTDPNCPNTNTSCTWSVINTGPNHRIDTAGQYRVRFTFPNGCFRTFYYNVFENTLVPGIHVVEPIICGNPGIIEVLNVPSTGYEFSLSPTGPFQSSPRFSGLTQARNYPVYIRQANGLPTACVFQTSIDLPSYEFNVLVIANDILCRDSQGSITVQITNGLPSYDYNLSNASGLNITHSSSQSTYTFNNLNPGLYTITALGANGLCTFTQSITVNRLPDLTLTATLLKNINCTVGSINLNAGGGTGPYTYAVYSVNGVVVPIANYQFQPDTNFTFAPGEEGTYVFIAVDANNCSQLSAPVTINLEPPITFTVNNTPSACSGADDGTINVIISGNTFGNALSYSIDNGITFQSAPTFSALAPGIYDIVFRATLNGSSCDQLQQVILAPATPITAIAVVNQDLGCSSNAIIEVTAVSGGVAPYTYSIDGTTYGSSLLFNVSAAGNYIIYVRDVNNCVFRTNPVAVTRPAPVTDITFTATAITCPLLTTDLTLAAIGGTAPFIYEIIAPAAAIVNNGTTNLFTNLAAGVYTFRVTDTRGCSYDESLVIRPLNPITVSSQTVSNITCFNETDGQIRFTVAGFVAGYSYTVAGPLTFTGTNQTNVQQNFTGPAGTYTFTATDTATNCSTTTTATIASPAAALTIDTLNITQLSCAASGVAAGSVSIVTSAGWGSNLYTLGLPNGTVRGPQQSSSFNNLTLPGVYTVEVRDGNNCIVSQSFTIDATVSPVLALNLNSDCYDPAAQATITATVATGGRAPFQYRLNGTAYQSSAVFANLTPGTYTIEIIDANNCTASATATVRTQLLATASLVKGLDCSSTPDAEINIDPSGGAPGYTYEVSINGAAFVAYTGGLPYIATGAGTYRFRVSDTATCNVVTNEVTVPAITQPAILSLVQTQTVLCNGDATGAFRINLDNTLGAAPFTVLVNGVNYGAQRLISGLTAGNYTVVVTDDNECSATDTIVIAEPTAITFTFDKVDITCNTTSGISLGEITVRNVAGGSPEYTYYLTNNFGFAASYDTVAGGEDHTFVIVDFGFYRIVVEDANGCTLNISDILIASPPSDLDINVSTTTPDCTSGATVIVQAVSAVGSGNYQFGILEFNTVPYTSTFLPSDLGTPDTRTFTGLLPGVIYTFVVYDMTTQCYFIKEAAFPTSVISNLTSSINPDDVTCAGTGDGTISFTFDNYDAGTSSVDYQVYRANVNTPVVGANGSAAVNPPTGAISVGSLGPLAPGRYFILFTEQGGTNAGCTQASAIFNIEEAAQPLILTATTEPDNCNVNAGQIAAVASQGSGSYTYIALPATAAAPLAGDSRWAAASVFNVEAGSYVVYVRDARNCIVAAPVTVAAAPILDVTIDLLNACAVEGTYAVEMALVSATPSPTGVPGYSLSLDGGAFTAISGLPHTVSQLTSGSHTFIIRDSNGCTDTETIVIAAPLEITAQVATQASCADDDGVISVQHSGGTGPFTFELLDSAMIVTPFTINGSNEFTALPAGTYTVRITDTATSCRDEITLTIETPTLPVLLTPVIANVTCNSSSDASITASIDAASAVDLPITYELFDTVSNTMQRPAQSNPLFDGLPAGSYTLRVTTGRNCVASQDVVITEPSVLIVSAIVTDFTCTPSNSVNVATIIVQIDNDTTGNTSGTAPYLYSIDGINFQTTNTFDIVDNGATQNITIAVRDNNGCPATTAITINPLATLTATAVTQNQALDCVSDESVIVSVIRGSGLFTFELLPNGPVFNNVAAQQQLFTLATAGDYTFLITDETTGCSILTQPFRVNEPIEADIRLLTIRDVSCVGSVDGVLSLELLNYTGAYDYELLDSAGMGVISGTSNTSVGVMQLTGVPAGNFTVVVTQTDVPFCEVTSNVSTINQPATALTIDLVQTGRLTCIPGADAGITATAAGGWNDYLYSINGGAFSTTRIFTNLQAGTYTIAVRDRAINFCEQTAIITIIAPQAIAATATAGTIDCFNDTNGTITATATGGQGPGNYVYALIFPDGSISAPQQSNVFTNLRAGSYAVQVADNLDCTATTNTVIIVNPAEVVAQASPTQRITCNQNATITVTGNNGILPYTYSSDGTNYGTSNVFTNLIAGNYQFYIRDANGCVSPVSNGITVEPLTPLVATQNLANAFVNCSGAADASLTITASGALGNYTYTLRDLTGNVIAGPQTSNFFNNLGAGSYITTVSSLDCDFVLPSFDITTPDAIVAAVNKTDITCFGENDGSITINATGGTGDFIYSLDQVRYDTNNILTNLSPGVYSIYVQDANGCFEVLSITINEPDELVGTSTIRSQEICAGDGTNSFEVTILGGTGPFTLSTDNINFITTSSRNYVFQDLLGDAAYPVFITDANGCTKIVPPTDFDAPILIEANYTVIYDCDGGNTLTITDFPENLLDDLLFSLNGGASQLEPVFVNVPQGTHVVEIMDAINGCSFIRDNIIVNAPNILTNLNIIEIGLNLYQITWDGGTPSFETTANDMPINPAAFVISASSSYTIVVTDSQGCALSITVPLEFIDIAIPNFFTPNGDGGNDLWRPDNIELFSDSIITIFDRYGRLLDRKRGTDSGWDGVYQSKQLPSGDYWYIIELRDERQRVFKGHFTLYR